MLLIKLAYPEINRNIGHAEKALKLFSSWGRKQASTVDIISAPWMLYNGLELTHNTSPGTELAERALSTFRPYTAFAADRNKKETSHPVSETYATNQ